MSAPRPAVTSDGPGLATTHRRTARHDRNDSYQKIERLAVLVWCISFQPKDQAMSTQLNRRSVLAAATDSLRDVHSLRDFLSAVHVGTQVANAMLTMSNAR